MEHELEKRKFFLSSYFQLILEREKTIIFLIQLIIALLVIASFTDRIISNTHFIKFLITVLLFLTPIMLVDYLLKLNNGLSALAKATDDKSSDEKKLYEKIIDGSAYLYSLVTILIIDIIIYLIIPNQTKLLIFYAIVQTVILILMYIYYDSFSRRINKRGKN